jgi:ceramide synthetase
MVAIGIAKEIITRLTYSLMKMFLLQETKIEYKNPKDLDTFLTKMASHVFKAFYYLAVSTVFVLQLKDMKIMHWFFGGELDTYARVTFFYDFPCTPAPQLVKDLNLFLVGYYTYESVFTVLYNRHRHDFAESLTHHISTLTLVSCSYVLNLWDFASYVYFLTSSSDVFVSLMRISYYWKSFAFKLFCFIGMLAGFIVMRDIFLTYALWEFYQQGYESEKAHWG